VVFRPLHGNVLVPVGLGNVHPQVVSHLCRLYVEPSVPQLIFVDQNPFTVEPPPVASPATGEQSVLQANVFGGPGHGG
jgi:hypothetical protein